MLIINKNVKFSIKLSRLWQVCTIPVLQSMVYWQFFGGFFPEQDHHQGCVCQPRCHHCLPCKGRVGGSQKTLCPVFQRPLQEHTQSEQGDRSWESVAWAKCLPRTWCVIPSKETELLSTNRELHPGWAGPPHSLPQQELDAAFVLTTLLLCAN